MAGFIQQSSPTTRSQRERAVIAFGGGKRATVKRDFRQSGRTLLRAGEQVQYFNSSTDERDGLVRVYREGARTARMVPASYLKIS